MTQESRLVIVIDSKNAERNTRAVADELANLTTKGGQAESQMTAMSSSIKSLVGYMGGILTINKAIAMADGYTQMAARIRNATASAEEYAMVQDRLLNTANTTYRQLGEAQEVYLSMAGGMKSLGKSTKDTLDLTDSLSFSFTHNATRVDQAQSAMDALSKSMAKGKVDGDAWISIVTGADNIIADMAKTTGKTEAEIRKLGAEGKASLNDLIKTLIATREQNEKLANNMENSLADGFTKLSNEVTVYLGKANEATSATGMLAGGLGTLADNLDLVANTGAVLGIGYITSALLTKGAAVKASIVLSAQQQIADRAELVSQTQLTAAEVRRTASLAQFTAMQLTDAKATAARMTGMQRLAYVQSTVIPLEAKATQATAAHTAATTANTVAQEINNKARSRGAMLLSLIGGPIGAITLGVTALAAGYMLMRDNADKATVSIDFQGQKVDDLVVKYRELSTLQRDNETKALSDQVEDLSVKFRVASSDLMSFMQALPASDEKIDFFVKLTKEYQNGKIKSDAYYDAVKNVNFLTDEQLDKVRGLTGRYGEARTKFNEAEVAQKALASAAKKTTQEAKEQAVSVANLSEEIKKLLMASSQNITDSKITEALASRGYNDTMIELAKKYLAVEGAIVENVQGQKVLRDDLKNMLKAEYDAIMKAKGAVDSRNEAEKERTKELEKQQKVLQVNSKVQANAAKYNFDGLESKYGLPKGTLSAIHAIETGNTGKTNQVNKQSGATGGFQFLKGTADQYGVKDRTNMAQSAEGAAKYMSYLLKLFKGDLEKAVRAYHAGEGNVQKGKNIGKYNNDYWSKFKGYTAGENGFTGGDVGAKEWERQLEEATRLLEEQGELRKNLEFNIASEVKQIRSRLAEDLEDIDKAGYSPEKAKELKVEYQTRADNDIAIASYALKTKLDDYEAFKKTESRLLEDSFNERKFYAARDLELTKDQRDKAVKLLDEQLKQEQAMLILAKETRIFQAEQAMYTEMDLIQKRYAFELQEIAKVQDTEERSRLLNAASFNKKESENDLLVNTTLNYKSAIGEDVSADRALIDRQNAIDEMYENGFIKQQEYELRSKQSRERYNLDMINLQLGYGQQVTGALSGMFGAMLGESSSAYRALYTAQQSFALAQAGMNVWKSASDAYANEPGTWYQKAAAAALATIESGTFVTMIQAATPKGFKSGGYTGNYGVNQEAGVVHGQEYVLNAAATKRVGVGTLDAINSGKSLGGGDVVNAPITVSVSVQSNGESSVDSQGQSKQLGQMIGNAVRTVIRQEQRQGGLLAK